MTINDASDKGTNHPRPSSGSSEGNSNGSDSTEKKDIFQVKNNFHYQGHEGHEYHGEGEKPRKEEGNETDGIQNVRVSDDHELDGLVRELAVEVRPQEEAKPMGYLERQKVRFRTVFGRSNRALSDAQKVDDDIESATASTEPERAVQYRLTARKKTKSRRWLGRFFIWFQRTQSNNDSCLMRYLSWTFHSSFFMVFLSMLAGFIVLVTIFAGLLTMAGIFKPECVYIGGSEYFDKNKMGQFGDMYQLSWTTFSTVGYGSVFPSTSVQTSEQTICVLFQFLCTMEAFIGILFAGFCGAVLFGKVLRIQSHANVLFSDPMCIRYGSGLTGSAADSSDDDTDSSDDEEVVVMEQHVPLYPGRRRNKKITNRIPCPVLEFRVLNKLCNQHGGEIMDASLTAVSASMTAGTNVNLTANDPKCGSNSFGSSDDGESERRTIQVAKASKTSSVWIFSKLDIESPDHPFFKRAWIARHVLNENSPLLKERVKKLIKKKKGYWPMELNSYQSIRRSLRFDQIIVSFSGTSNVSGSSVYAQKIYDAVDVNIGYQFAPILYHDHDTNTMSVDADMINDVVEQSGGGGEPLTAEF